MVSGSVLIGLHDRCFTLKLVGDVRVPWCVSLENYCEAVVKRGAVSTVCVDLTETENLDSTTLGVLAKLAIQARAECGANATLVCQDDDLLRLLQSMAFEQVFDIDTAPQGSGAALQDLPFIDCSELELQDSVIDAHRILMALSEENRAEFIELVTALENSRPV